MRKLSTIWSKSSIESAITKNNRSPMPTLHALLTAVNQYHPHSDKNVSNLYGCKNDILGLQAFLEDRFPKDRRNIATLIDGDATYKNVVQLFGDELLGRASKGDIVLFAYSGHGSREGAAQEFDRYYPEGLEETLVLHDSRTPGGLDLADKELALLIERLALKDAHVVVLLDCCHSGSGTRNLEDITLGGARQTSNRKGRRPLDSYLEGAFAKRGNGLYLPNSRHILLAACDRKEKAYELTTNRGLFSTHLLKVLEETGGQLSYADLFARTRAGMSRVTDRQHPQFEPYGLFNAYEGFLGLSGASQGAPLRIFFDNEKWQASMGAVHGLPVGSGRPATFEVLRNGQPLGAIQTRAIGMEASTLAIPEFALEEGESYEARLTSLPAPKTIYGLSGDADKIREALLAQDQFNPLFFELRTDASHPAYRMEVEEKKIQLFRNADGLLLRSIEGSDWDRMFADAFEKLEHIARWEKTVELDNPDVRIDRSEVELILSEIDDSGNIIAIRAGNEVTVDILLLNGVEQKVPFRLDVRNKNSQKARHCALFYATADYGIRALGYNELVPAGTTVTALERTPKGKRYAFELNGKSEETDIFKLFISNSPISGEALGQKDIRIGESVQYERTKGMRGERAVLGKRGIGLDEEGQDEDINDWFAITLRVKSVAKVAGVGNQTISLVNDVIKISAHPSFRAGVGVASVNTAARSIEPMSLIAELAANTGLEMLAFGEVSRGLSSLNMLELTDIQQADSLKEQPLELEIAAQLKGGEDEEEMMLPLTFDGEHLLPIGEVSRLENGGALVRISHLPDTTDTRRRSLGKALKLCFLKTILKKKKVCFLQWVDYKGEKAVRKEEGLFEKVKAADNILLLLHGIIGDTAEMAESMRRAQAQDLADLVLTFDYENLNTPIEKTAEALDRMLRNAGLDSSKHLTILAHSMGGLVSRYFIENLGGKELVKHLILAGTPSGGASIARITTYRDYAIPLLTLLINTPWGIPAAATALGVLEKSKDLTVTLAQMDYERGDFLQNLNRSADPGIPYHIVAGNLELFLGKNQDKKSLMDKAYRLGGKLFYGDQPNDIAVSIDSIKAVPADRTPQPKAIEVDCHHLNYFTEPESMDVLMKFLSLKT